MTEISMVDLESLRKASIRGGFFGLPYVHRKLLAVAVAEIDRLKEGINRLDARADELATESKQLQAEMAQVLAAMKKARP
jgi:predicted  nucleic acid-binding Zn-ribbon protein